MKIRLNYLLITLITSLSCFLSNIGAVEAQLSFNQLPFSKAFTSELNLDVGVPTLSSAAIRLDGRSIFRVPSVGGITAVDRAKEISQRLQTSADQRIATVKDIQWKIESSSNQPVIYAGDRFIMTVTSADATLVGVGYPEIRAEELQQTIADALAYYGYERQPEILQQRWRWAGGILVAMLVLSFSSYRLNTWISSIPKTTDAAAQTLKQRIVRRQAERLYQFKNWFFWLGQLFIFGGGIFMILGLFPYSRVWQQPLIHLLHVPAKITIIL
ncbi:MAG: hypothetical protein F6K11_31980, partial [Leptolyngbya sp. SIO3F4]|nr:hypothetical protein [Leptolyngbya sp. SIO3F4]